MPIYEYDLSDGECQMCPGHFEVLQSLDEDALEHCPGCGLPCKRVVSRVSFSMRTSADPDSAAKKGFTTWKRARKGEWEKLAGPGVDGIVSSDEDKQAIEAEKKKPKVIDLDSD